MGGYLTRMRRSKVIRRLCLITCDLGLCVVAYVLASVLRFAPDPLPQKEAAELWACLPMLLAVRLPLLFAFDLYRLSWRYVGLVDLLRILKATTLSEASFAVVLAVSGSELSRAALVIDWLLITCFLGGLRLLLRGASGVLRRQALRKRNRRRVVILGVNDLGESLARDFETRQEGSYQLVGFLDADGLYQGQTIHGRPVLGALADLPTTVVQHQVQDLIIALPQASGAQIRQIIRMSERLPVHLRIVQDPWDGYRQVALAQVRDIRLEDLLRRPPVRVDLEQVAEYLSGATVLVTGAGGSIGSELVRQLAGLRPRALILLGHGEHSIFQIQQELQQELGFDAVPVIADVADRRRLDQVFTRYRPSVVFHAAAHKHVPLMEHNIPEAVKINILGTRNLLQACERHGVGTFLMISTDKAVNPTSVMGASKRVAEMLVQAASQRFSGRTMIVRFGNVLGSRGSVVPVIQRQILRNLPVTITHPDMVRFFMTIPEAVSLVIQAGAMGRRGEVFVLDMGEPVRILDLARDLVRLCGLVPDRDVRFRFTGIRPGEKLYEEVLTEQEGLAATRHDRIFSAPGKPVNEAWLHSRVEALAAAAAAGDDAEILQLFRELVPGYQPTGPAAALVETNRPPSPELHTGGVPAEAVSVA